MNLAIAALIAALVLAGCARTTPPPPVDLSSTQIYTGQVWLLDRQDNTVTLRLASNELVRLRVNRDQFRTLRMHETATVRGVPTGPAEISHSVVQLAMLAPRGPADVTEVAGRVASIDPAGRAVVDTPSGPVEVWIQPPGTYRVGGPVRVRMSVQPLEIAPLKPGETPPVAQAAPGIEPGDYTTLRTRITGVQPGRLTVESPRGPVVVIVPAGDRYAPGGAVEVRTSVHPAP